MYWTLCSCIVLLKESGEMEEVPTLLDPSDMAAIDNNTVVVSQEKVITIINISYVLLQKTIAFGMYHGLE